MPRRSKEEIARRARSVFDDFHDTELSTPEIATKHRISVSQVRKDVAWWWAHHEEFELPKTSAPNKKRKQCYDEIWDWDAEDFAVTLNRFGPPLGRRANWMLAYDGLASRQGQRTAARGRWQIRGAASRPRRPRLPQDARGKPETRAGGRGGG